MEAWCKELSAREIVYSGTVCDVLFVHPSMCPRSVKRSVYTWHHMAFIVLFVGHNYVTHFCYGYAI